MEGWMDVIDIILHLDHSRFFSFLTTDHTFFSIFLSVCFWMKLLTSLFLVI